VVPGESLIDSIGGSSDWKRRLRVKKELNVCCHD
jgi:hypothetical protein